MYLCNSRRGVGSSISTLGAVLGLVHFQSLGVRRKRVKFRPLGKNWVLNNFVSKWGFRRSLYVAASGRAVCRPAAPPVPVATGARAYTTTDSVVMTCDHYGLGTSNNRYYVKSIQAARQPRK